MDTSYFVGEMIGELEDICYPEERNPHENKMTLHFENAPKHLIKSLWDNWSS
jgi:hypothetical protein